MQTPNPHDTGWDTAPAAPSSQPPEAGPVWTEPPLLLGRYRVVETRGTGGFASVKVCWDIRLQRRVAIKCMPLSQAPGTSSSTLREALEEARITSRLTHPNIVTVHDFELAGNTAYLIMEYVDGLTLAELLSRVEGGVLTYDECAHLLSCLANALAYAHENDVLHLDIKPSNVFIDTTGAIKLGDFGMASLASAAGWEGARGGTVGYMPPEQLSCGLVDERTDIFALAVVCYQALTGTSPFIAATAEASLKHIERGAKPLAKVEGELKGPVSDGIARALSADPGARPSSVGEFADSVLPYLGDEDAGRDSLAGIMAQVTGTCGPDERTWEQAAHVRLAERYPWLAGACLRTTAGLVCAVAALRLAPQAAGLLGPDAQALAPAVGFVALGVAGAASPRAGTMAAGFLLVAATLSHGAYSPAFLVALAAGLALLGWWGRHGTSHPLAGTALMAPAALGLTSSTVGLAGLVLTPMAAGVTATLATLLEVVATAASASASGPELALACARAATMPATWTAALAMGLAAWLCAAVGRLRRPKSQVVGQLLAALVVIGAQAGLVRVENGGIWSAGAAANVAVAVLCSLLLSIAVVTFGPAPKPREDE